MSSPPSRSWFMFLLVALCGAGRNLQEMITGFSQTPAGLSVLADTIWSCQSCDKGSSVRPGAGGLARLPSKN